MKRNFDPTAMARGRLAVLTSHLIGAATVDSVSAVLEASPVSAQEIARQPGNLSGKLKVTDSRTGKQYDLEISEDGTVKAVDFKKITTGKDDKGVKIYDPGYLNTAPVRSSVCYIDGDEGILRYRGYPIEELAENSTFLEVAFLLMYGNLPSKGQLADWEFTISQHSAVPQGLLDIIQGMPHDAHPMGLLVSAMSTLSVFHPDANPALREMEEMEMVVRHMWDVYTHSRRIRFPRFWQEAFEAAYEDLASDEAGIRDSTVTEIARMSMKMVDLESPPRKAKVVAEHLTVEEVAYIKDMFKKMDINNNGRITLEELKYELHKHGHQILDADVQILMEAADVDGDGTLEYGEFVALSIHLQKLGNDEHLHKAFAFFDQNKSGYIEIEELRDALADDLGSNCEEVINAIISDVDTNKDGKISYEEFAAMMKAGTDWRKASRQYSRERFNSLSLKLMKDGSLLLKNDGRTNK